MVDSRLTLRRASEDDEQCILAWRNDPVTRRFSFDEQVVSVDEHAAWFRAKLSEPGTVLLIAEEDGTPVGQVRLDRSEPGRAEVHIAVAPEARGRGIATEMVRIAVEDAPALLGVTKMVARVKPSNDASLRLFLRAGFWISTTSPDLIELERTLNG